MDTHNRDIRLVRGKSSMVNVKIIAAAAASVVVVAALAYIASTQSSNNVEEIFGAGFENVAKCVDGDFVADPKKQTVEIDMSVYQWKFSYCHITVYEGQTITLTLQSLDVPHGFAIDGYPEIRSTFVSPQAPSKITFTANKLGEFIYYCTVFCGEGHPLHKGSITVQGV
jgi:cytochrome c oxidase subunit 2